MAEREDGGGEGEEGLDDDDVLLVLLERVGRFR